MSEQQLKAFLQQVNVDAGLQERLNCADPYTVFAIAQENGFIDLGQDLERVEPMLSEIELENVAGGLVANRPSTQYESCTVTLKLKCH